MPAPRGPLSDALVAWWRDRRPLPDLRCSPHLRGLDPLADDDLHVALWSCFELHYHGLAGVRDDVEWEPETIAFRRQLERCFEQALRAEHHSNRLPNDPLSALRVIAERPGPPLARTIEERGGRRELEEFAIHRSAYQLKEADPHSWAIPRLTGSGRSAMIEIQVDEYGGGRPGETHSDLFAAGMGDLGLDNRFGAYIDCLPGTTLATDNLASMFGLQRRMRGALVGHLAMFEMCSVVPMGRYLNAARRIGGLPNLERFYAVHVEADVHHADLALQHMVAELVAAEPDLAPEVVFGADAVSRVESLFAAHVLGAWEAGRSSLRVDDIASRRPPVDSGFARHPLSVPAVAGHARGSHRDQVVAAGRFGGGPAGRQAMRQKRR